MISRLTALVFALLLVAVLCGPQISDTIEGPNFVPASGCKIKAAAFAPVAPGADTRPFDQSLDSCAQPTGYDPQCYFFDGKDKPIGFFEETKRKCFFPLFDANYVLHPKLKQYPADAHYIAYPPWTYNGFHSPAKWGNIPPDYFARRPKKLTGRFTGLVVGGDKETGISFIEPAPESPLKNFGICNCSDTYFPAPLNIITANAKDENSFVEFSFNNFKEMNAFMMFFPEDGTDLLFVKLQNHPKQTDKRPIISKGATTGNSLTFDRLLIHYGSDSDVGSEHKINGKSYGMELQFFFNLQNLNEEIPYYRTLEDYLIQEDQNTYGKNLLVLCVLVEVANTTAKVRVYKINRIVSGSFIEVAEIKNTFVPQFPPAGKEFNKGMKILSQAAEAFHKTHNLGKYRAYASSMKVLQFSDFFENPNKGHYYTYYGSLTHPPCFNNTRYVVFETPLFMRRTDWRKFLFIPSAFSDTTFVAGNFRPMETMMVRNNKTKRLRRFDKNMQERVSYTVKKSRISSKVDRLGEYDYYEDKNLTIEFRKKHSRKSNSAVLVKISRISISISFLAIIAVFVLMNY